MGAVQLHYISYDCLLVLGFDIVGYHIIWHITVVRSMVIRCSLLLYMAYHSYSSSGRVFVLGFLYCRLFYHVNFVMYWMIFWNIQNLFQRFLADFCCRILRIVVFRPKVFVL